MRAGNGQVRVSTDFAVDTCANCGGPNPVWSADSRLWNEVMTGDPDREAAGYLCPPCFMATADHFFESTPWRVTGWRLIPDLRRRT